MTEETVDFEILQTLLTPRAVLLGLDLGTKTIGVATGSMETGLASPLETIKRTKFTADALRLREVAEEWGAAALVLGLPLNMDGTEGPRSQSTRSFARNLKLHFDLPTLLWDERLSTEEADEALVEGGARKAKRDDLIDQAAAVVILQEVLDKLKATS